MNRSSFYDLVTRHALEDFVRLPQGAGIHWVIDVRTNPGGRDMIRSAIETNFLRLVRSTRMIVPRTSRSFNQRLVTKRSHDRSSTSSGSTLSTFGCTVTMYCDNF